MIDTSGGVMIGDYRKTNLNFPLVLFSTLFEFHALLTGNGLFVVVLGLRASMGHGSCDSCNAFTWSSASFPYFSQRWATMSIRLYGLSLLYK